jgi:tetratricopeptide (TPR) repeat protein
MGKSSRRKRQIDEVAIKAATGSLHESKGVALSLLAGRGVVSFLIIAAVGLMAYANSFGVPFVFDDKLQIALNPMIKSLNNFVLYFKGDDIGSTAGYTFVPSRLVGYLTFALNYAIGRLDVTGYHIFNLAVHIINAVLVYILLFLTFQTPHFTNEKLTAISEKAGNSLFTIHYSRFVPLFAALLFVSHPIQTQAVTYIAQRFASLATMFYLFSLVLYLYGRLRTQRGDNRAGVLIVVYALSLLSALLAMKTKEIAFTLPLIIILYEFIFFSTSLKKRLLFMLPILLMLIIIPLTLVGTNKPLGELLSDIAQVTRLQTTISRTDYFLTELTVIATYIRLIFLPVGQNLDYDYPVFHSFFAAPVFLSFLLISSILATAIYLLYRSRQGTTVSSKKLVVSSEQTEAEGGRSRNDSPFTIHFSRLIAFGILWFFITLSVESSFIPIVDVIFEHRVYLPSIGAFIAIAACMNILVYQFKRIGQKKAVILCALLIAVLSAATFMRNNIWRSEVSLWEDVVKKSPHKVRALLILAIAYLQHGRIDEARPLLKELSMHPFDSPDFHERYYISLSSLDLEDDKFDAAEESLRKALEINRNSFEAYSDLCHVLFKKGQLDEALEACGRSLSLMPNYPPALNNISSVYRKLGNMEEAIKSVKIAIAYDPDYALPYNNLGLAYVAGNRFDDAIAAFKQALLLEPYYAEAYNNLAGVYMVSGDFGTAIAELQKALKISPNYSRSHYNLGISLHMRGNRDEALKEYQILQKMSPKDADALLAVMQRK